MQHEKTEEQRNIRQAAFRVIENLGEIQEIVDARYYYLPFDEGMGDEAELKLRGFGSVAMSRDLMSLMPAPAPEIGADLHAQWLQHFNALDDLGADGRHTEKARQAEEVLRNSLDRSRAEVMKVLRELD